MPTKIYRTKMNCTPEDLWTLHATPGSFRKLTPWFMPVKPLTPLHLEVGAVHAFKAAGLVSMSVKIVEAEQPHGFADQTIKVPGMTWIHHHRFLPDGDGAILEDHLAYESKLPAGPILDLLFKFRHRKTREAVE